MLTSLVGRLPTVVRTHIERRRNLLRAAENTGWIVANNVLGLLITLVIGVWVARYLGAVQYGLFNYIFSLNSVFRSIIPLGMTNLVVRDLARAGEPRSIILGSAFFVQLTASAFMLLVAIALSILVQRDDPVSQQLTRIISITLLLTPFEMLSLWFQSQLQSVKVVIANSASLLMMAAARIWLISVEASLTAFVYLLIVERAINVFAMLSLYHRSGESIWRWSFDGQYAWRIVREGLPLFWSALTRTVYTRGNAVMLKMLAGAAEVGYYSAANRIAELYILVPSAIVSSATPIITQSKTQDRVQYLKQMTSLLRVAFGIGIFSTIVISLAAQWMMPLIFGEEFAAAGNVLVHTMWSAIPLSFNVINGLWVINEGLAVVQFQKGLAMAGLVVGLNWLLIPLYGASGAAISILIASTLVYFLWDFLDPRVRGLGMLKLHAFMPWWFGLKDL